MVLGAGRAEGENPRPLSSYLSLPSHPPSHYLSLKSQKVGILSVFIPIAPVKYLVWLWRKPAIIWYACPVRGAILDFQSYLMMLVDVTLEAYSGLLVFPELGIVDWGAKVGERGRQLTCSWRPYYSFFFLMPVLGGRALSSASL